MRYLGFGPEGEARGPCGKVMLGLNPPCPSSAAYPGEGAHHQGCGDGEKLAGDPMLCWLQAACVSWPPGGLIIPACDVTSPRSAAAALSRALLALSLFRRSVVTASRR